MRDDREDILDGMGLVEEGGRVEGQSAKSESDLPACLLGRADGTSLDTNWIMENAVSSFRRPTTCADHKRLCRSQTLVPITNAGQRKTQTDHGKKIGCGKAMRVAGATLPRLSRKLCRICISGPLFK